MLLWPHAHPLSLSCVRDASASTYWHILTTHSGFDLPLVLLVLPLGLRTA